MIQIDKNIPLPVQKGTKRTSWPFRDMEIGDSFAVEEKDVYRIRAAADYQHKHGGGKYSTRKFNGAFRCWRIK